MENHGLHGPSSPVLWTTPSPPLCWPSFSVCARGRFVIRRNEVSWSDEGGVEHGLTKQPFVSTL